MKYRMRFEQEKHVATIEDDNGKRLDEKSFTSYKDAMALRDAAHEQGVKAFAEVKAKAKERSLVTEEKSPPTSAARQLRK